MYSRLIIEIQNSSDLIHILYNELNSTFKLFINPNNNLNFDIDNSTTIEITIERLSNLKTFQIFIIDSINAGNSNHLSSFYNDILNPILTFLNINNTYLKTNSSNSIESFANSVNLNFKNLYLFLSGDTSIFEFINFLILKNSFNNNNNNNNNNLSNANLTILPFPHGTGNALCNSLNLSNNLLSLKALFIGNFNILPIYKLISKTYLKSENPTLSSFFSNSNSNNNNNNSIYFLIVASWCLHSTLVYKSDIPEMRLKYGEKRFKIAAQNILNENPIFKGNIIFKPENKSLFFNNNKWSLINNNNNNNKSIDLSYFLLSAASNLEKNFKISPYSIIAKNQLHLLTIPYLNSNIIMNLMNKAYNNGSHINDSNVFYSSINSNQSIELNISNEMDPSLSIICLDGSSWQVTGIDRKLTFTYFNQSFLHYLA